MTSTNEEKISSETTSKIKSDIDLFMESIHKAADASAFGIPTLDQIESAWGDLERATRQRYCEMTSKVISSYSEKAAIESKKASTEKGA